MRVVDTDSTAIAAPWKWMLDMGESAGSAWNFVDRYPSIPVKRIAAFIALAVFAFCGAGIFSCTSIAEFIKESHRDNLGYQVIAEIDQLYANLKDAQAAQRQFIITGDSSFLKAGHSAMDAISASLSQLQILTADNPFDQQKIKQIKPLIVVDRAKGFNDVDEIHTSLMAMARDENRLLNQRMSDVQTNGSRGIVIIALSTTLALMLVLVAGWMVHRDLTGRQCVEQAFRSSESLFRGLLQSAPDAMVITNQVGTIELVNVRAEALFGYTAAKLIGQSIQIILPVGIHLDSNLDRELTGLHRDGSQFPVEISHSPVQTPGGLHVSLTIRDVTHQRDEEHQSAFLNAALSESNAQLEAANKELESFSYSVSHDLRAPLRSIDGFSQAILEDYTDKLDEEGKDHLNRVRAATQRMGHLIDDLLNLSRVTRAEMHREQVDLSRIAREIADELRSAAPGQEVELVVADDVVAYTDARLIRIVLTNLLNNAWKFTSKRQLARIEFGSMNENGKTQYFVSDNGAGFDPAYSSRLFGAFQRLHSSTEYAGTGIGLATVQRIVRRQGGNIWAQGKLDQGATFHFTL